MFNYTNYLHDKLSEAIILATKVHKGQVDKSGEPYILHPLAVMSNVPTLMGKIIAVLHDVIEDADDVDSVVNEIGDNFPAIVLISLSVLTHPKHEPYEDYIQRIVDYREGDVRKLIRAVKLADLDHNMSRLYRIEDTATYTRLRDKYGKALHKIRNMKERVNV
jgi:(p)ppGpp synthase/HD superfamily hydrolase